jgi:hypothetical protein
MGEGRRCRRESHCATVVAILGKTY